MIEISQVRFTCVIDNGQSVYPLQNFIGLIDHEVAMDDGTTEVQTIKCTRNAAASIALACAESSYEQATLMLNRLAGFDLTVTTEFRVADSVGAEFVRGVPSEIKSSEIEKTNEKIGSNTLKSRVDQLNSADDQEKVDEVIRKAIKDGPDGVLYKDYAGAKFRVMYVLCDGTGVPGRRQELAGIKGKQSDGSAKTFEAKIGAVFTMEYTAGGKPLLTGNGEIYRDKKICYMGTVRKVEDFGPMLYAHAMANGLEDVDAVVFLGDGAKWLWGIQNDYFPYAMTGVDLYHAIERVSLMVDLLQFKGQSKSERKRAFLDECVELLRHGKVQEMLELIEAAPCKAGSEKKLEGALGYFRSNRERMNYGAFSACGIFVGSGVIEAGCKVIVGTRMKNAGMHWSKDHAEKMISLRCAIRNGSFFDSYLHDRISVEKTAA